jgi:hypothetical protein
MHIRAPPETDLGLVVEDNVILKLSDVEIGVPLISKKKGSEVDTEKRPQERVLLGIWIAIVANFLHRVGET